MATWYVAYKVVLCFVFLGSVGAYYMDVAHYFRSVTGTTIPFIPVPFDSFPNTTMQVVRLHDQPVTPAPDHPLPAGHQPGLDQVDVGAVPRG